MILSERDIDYINIRAQDIHQRNVEAGWWTPEQDNAFIKGQLLITEVAEATEGERKNLMDDHLPHREMGEVELADAMIRTLDLGARLGLPVIQIDGFDLNVPEGSHFCRYHFAIVVVATVFVRQAAVHSISSHSVTVSAYSRLVYTILAVANAMGHDLWGALHEKLEYNAIRVDHKPENRAKENGKKC